MKLTGKHIGIIILGLITAIAHLAAAFDKELFEHGPDPLFILNGLGYLGLLGAYFLPIPFFQQRHELVRRGFILYCIITIAAWVFIWVIQYVIIQGVPFFSRDSVYGVPAKIAELLLIWLLSTDKQEKAMQGTPQMPL
jgi:hypothetical protein